MTPTDWPIALGFAAETTLGVTTLVLLVLLLRKPVAKRFGAGAAYALWALPLIRLVLPPLPSGWSLWSSVTVGSGEAVPSAERMGAETITMIADAPSAGIVGMSNQPPMPPAPPEIAMSSPINWALVIATVWAIGAAVALGLTIYRHRKFMQVVDAEVEPANGKLQMMAEDTAAEIGLRRKVRVCTSLISSGPMVPGLVRPTVLLPVWFEEDYSRDEQRAAMAHEFTHVKRGDLWALQFAYAGMALQWFNPLAHWALRAFRSDQEAACDADVLRCTSMTPRAYGAALVKAVKLSMPERTKIMPAGLPLTHAIKDRLVLMQTPQPSFKKKILGGGLTAIIGAAAMVATASAHPPEKDSITINGITISDGELTINGKTYEDRRFVLLDEPFNENEFHFEFEGDFEELGEALAKEGEALAEMFEDMDFSAMVELDGLEDLEQLAELEILAELPEMIEGLVAGSVDVTTLDDGSMQIVIPKQKIVLPENLERLEEHADRMAERAEAWAERDGDFRERMEAVELRAERMRERAEAHSEALSFKLESHIQPTTNAIDALAKSCADENLKDGHPVIFESEIDGKKRKLKALCLKGSELASRENSIEEFLAEIPEISDAQRQRVIEQLSQSGHSSTYEFELRGGENELED